MDVRGVNELEESPGVDGIDVSGYGVAVAERDIPRISSMAIDAFEARRFEARNRARWARKLNMG